MSYDQNGNIEPIKVGIKLTIDQPKTWALFF